MDRTVIINPGYLSRGANPDSFAKILVPSLGSVNVKTVAATPDGTAAGPAGEGVSASEVERTDLPERIKVEIIKLD